MPIPTVPSLSSRSFLTPLNISSQMGHLRPRRAFMHEPARAGGRGWQGRVVIICVLSQNGPDLTMEFPSRGTCHGYPVDRRSDHAASPAHAAGHAYAGPGLPHAAGLRSPRPALCRIPWPRPRHRDHRGHPTLPTSPARERRRTCDDQRRGLGVAVPVHGDPEAAESGARWWSPDIRANFPRC